MIREAVSEGSSSWTLGEYAVSIRSDLRSAASLMLYKPRQMCRALRPSAGKERFFQIK